MNFSKKMTIILNCIIAISTIVIASLGIIFGAGDGQVGTYVIGWGYLKAYTMDSNILAGIMALFVVIFGIKNMRSDKELIPKWLMRGYLMGTTCLLVTFLVVIVLLAPGRAMSGGGYFSMFSGDMFFFHFLNPILSTVSFIWFLEGEGFRLSDCFVGLIPTIVYSIIYFIMVIVVKKWNDFYNFTFGGRYFCIPIVIVVIYGVAFLISYFLIRVRNNLEG